MWIQGMKTAWKALPTGWKIGSAAAVAIALFVAVQWYGNKQWSKGEAQGRQFVADQLVKEKEKDWAERERKIEDTKTLIEEQTEMLKQITAQVAAARAQLKDQYAAITARETAQRDADERIIASVPDSDLRAAIRAISAELDENRTASD